jgi:formylglycine-generating enzyme required for sulfatase activity/serine/threonine protein kinase
VDTHYFALPEGSKLFEFEIISVLGHGGFGITYLATDTLLQETVALKEFFPNDLAVRITDATVRAKSVDEQPDFEAGLRAFLEEARLMARFRHRNLVHVRRFFELHGTGYIVQDYEHGQTLSHRLGEGPIDEQELRRLLAGVLDGLEVVHERAILHRDLKPDNVILRDDGVPVLIDFGAARDFAGRHSRSVTAITAGGYTPPEQWGVGGQQGPWSDLYALGAIAYRCVTGASLPISLQRLRTDPLVPATTAARGQYDPVLLATIDWMLTVDEAKRPASVQAVRAALAGASPIPEDGPDPSSSGSLTISSVRPEEVMLAFGQKIDGDVLELAFFAEPPDQYLVPLPGQRASWGKEPYYFSVYRTGKDAQGHALFTLDTDIVSHIPAGAQVTISSKDGYIRSSAKWPDTQRKRSRLRYWPIAATGVVLMLLAIGGAILFFNNQPAPPPEIAAGQLTIAGPQELGFSGEQGGPFNPSAISLQLKATGSGFHWSTVGAMPAWLSIVPDQGDLTPDGSAQVTVTLTPIAQSLTPGRYESEVVLKNDSTGAIVASSANVVVSPKPPPRVAAGQLTITGPQELGFTGEQGGPFSPSGISLKLKATDGDIHWSTVDAPTWLSIFPDRGDLTADSSAWVAVTLTPDARSLTPGRYESQVVLKNDSTGATVASNVSIVVSPKPPPPVVAGQLTITGPQELGFTGEQGGPFSPSGISLQLKATGSGFHWSTVGATPSWLNIVPDQGDLTADGSAQVTVRLTPIAQSLTPGRYESQVVLKNYPTGAVVASNVSVVVSPKLPPPVAATQPQVSSPVPLSAERERALKPKDTFKECANCPQMLVVPAGTFTMGSPASESGQRLVKEVPQHEVTIARQFAVGQFELTFDEWDACVAADGCKGYKPSDYGWGRGRQPAVSVSWVHANAYVAWLKKLTGKPYRLLSEAEYEYAARAGTTTAYPWGNAIGKNNANCDGCGSQWDKKQTAPVGSFAANGFGLYDMIGNVREWTQDCFHDSYSGAPTDGSVWTGGDCRIPVLRGGSWGDPPDQIRSAWRAPNSALSEDAGQGFRVARTLLTP